MDNGRLSWDEYFMKLAEVVSCRSTCLRRRVGAVAVKDRRVLATGYNGAPRGVSHCSETGCVRQELKVPSGQKHELCRGLHAEQNLIIQAAYHGVSINKATIYCTNQPCVMCAKMIVNSGITEVLFKGEYPDDLALSIFKESGIKLRRV